MDTKKIQKSDKEDNQELKACPYTKFLGKLNNFLEFTLYSIPPGPKFIPLNLLINIQKGGTWILVLSMMIYFNNFSLGAWIYFALHGSYGICWIMKDFIFPDKKFSEKITIMSSSLPISVMTMYLIPAYIMISSGAGNNPSIERVATCFVSYLTGLFLMVCSDLQKYYTLKYGPRRLINDGFFKMTRNPNYLGEILIYNSFAIIANGWEFWIVLAVAYTLVFGLRMLAKEYSLMRKEGWREYDSYMLLPKFSSSCSDNIVIYGFVFGLIYFVHSSGGMYTSISILSQTNCSELAASLCTQLRNSYLCIQNIIQGYL